MTAITNQSELSGNLPFSSIWVISYTTQSWANGNKTGRWQTSPTQTCNNAKVDYYIPSK